MPGMSTEFPEALRDRATTTAALSSDTILDAAAVRRIELELPYAGAVTPPEAWQLFTRRDARLVDVRSAAEVHYVGRVPRALHVEWRGADAEPVARFLATLRTLVGADERVLFLCRSGVRSHHAALAAQTAGLGQAYNVLEGFEGQRNHAMQRGLIDGWRRHGLPWEQD
jgi:rhodanese-related sulfurtransferase